MILLLNLSALLLFAQDGQDNTSDFKGLQAIFQGVSGALKKKKLGPLRSPPLYCQVQDSQHSHDT